MTENLDTELADPAYRQFLRVFESFKMEEKPVQEVVKTEEVTQNGEKEIDPRTLTKVPKIGVEEDEDEDEEEERDKDVSCKLLTNRAPVNVVFKYYHKYLFWLS